jgi:ABC-2 type transport system permease protein
MNAELFTLLLPALFLTYAIGRGARLVAGESRGAAVAVSTRAPNPALKRGV